MNKNQKQKSKKTTAQTNTLESLKDIGTSATKSLKEDLIEKVPRDFMEQIFGPRIRNYSGEISPGESIEIEEVFTGQYEEKKNLEKKLALERRLRQEEKVLIERKTNELRIQINVLQEEVLTLAQKTQELGEETQIAAMQVPVEPGVYHVIFFEKLIEFIKSFTKKIEEASVWLHATNKRAQKKNVWGARYKKYGAKYLLSGEHYLSRSAG